LCPALAFVPISHTWHGPIDRSPDGLPFYERVGRRKNLVAGLGFSGNGVAPCFVGGQILASMVLESDDDWSRSPLVRPAPATYPPEPVRYVGSKLVRGAAVKKDQHDLVGSRPGPITRELLRFLPPAFSPPADSSSPRTPS